MKRKRCPKRFSKESDESDTSSDSGSEREEPDVIVISDSNDSVVICSEYEADTWSNYTSDSDIVTKSSYHRIAQSYGPSRLVHISDSESCSSSLETRLISDDDERTPNLLSSFNEEDTSGEVIDTSMGCEEKSLIKKTDSRTNGTVDLEAEADDIEETTHLTSLKLKDAKVFLTPLRYAKTQKAKNLAIKKEDSTRSKRLKINKEPDVLTFNCEICGTKCKSKTSLSKHELSHTNTRSHKCNVCSKPFPSKSKLDRHIRGVHEKEKNYFCEFCDKSFFTEYEINRHMEEIHSNTKNHRCNQCNEKFRSNRQLQLHRRIAHENCETFECESCGKQFKHKWSLKRHVVKKICR